MGKQKRVVNRAQPLEQRIQADLIEYLRARGWLVERMIGNAYQVGIPDLYLFHHKHQQRWVDVKRPVGWALTKAQKIKWPFWEKSGVGIWILTEATQAAYDKLFQPPNWRQYVRGRLPVKQDVARALDDLANQA